MAIERELNKQLLDWKNNPAHKALDNLLAVKEWQLSSAVVLCHENAGGGAGDATGLRGDGAGSRDAAEMDGPPGKLGGAAGSGGGAGSRDVAGAVSSGVEQTPPLIAYLPWYAISFMEQDRLPEKLIVSI